MQLQSLHHIAIICSDYQTSRKFYTEVMGFKVIAEHFREQRNSWKCDLSLNGQYLIELFSFPSPPKRVSRPEAAGLRHLAFRVNNIREAVAHLESHGVECEPVRIDEYTGKHFTFFGDPDNLPLELYQDNG